MSFHKRIESLISCAGISFILLTVVAPMSLLAIAYLKSMSTVLLGTHILSGLVWFLLVVASPVSVLLMENYLASDNIYDWFIQNIPRLTFLAFGAGLTAVVSGSVLFLSTPPTGNERMWRLLALSAGWFIFFLGLFGPNRFHLGVFYEEMSQSPDERKISSLNKKNIIVGGFEAVLIITFVVAMNFL